MSDLKNIRVIITRSRLQANEFAKKLRALNAQPLLFPSIKISFIKDTLCLDSALSKLDHYAWLVMTSVNGVKSVWQRMDALGIDDIPSGTKVAAIGPKTAAALENRGVTPDFVPDDYVAEAVLPGLGDVQGRWVLLPRADLARPALPNAIQAADGIAHEITAYHTLPAEPYPGELTNLKAGADVLTFTSPSTVRNFVTLAKSAGLDPFHISGEPVVACIGPITAQAARDQGYHVDIIAKNYTIEGLIESMISKCNPLRT